MPALPAVITLIPPPAPGRPPAGVLGVLPAFAVTAALLGVALVLLVLGWRWLTVPRLIAEIEEYLHQEA